MCGIAGLFDCRDRRPEPEVLSAMASRIVHRGPDEEGSLTDSGVGLVSRRLRIIDLEGGTQPIFNEDRSVAVVFNGEIYNFAELREQLRAKGHSFATSSDTEVLVHLYEDRGEDFLSPLRGMFALALWDFRQRIGIVARDRLGKKPLVYFQTPEKVYFASEIQALAAVPCFPREIEPAAVGDYLEYGYVPAPGTIFRSVRKLPPAHMLVWKGGHISLRRYWQLTYEPKTRLDETEALQELETRLDEAVRMRLVAEVPLGALLSGGVDSSAVVALMARHSTRVKTFSIGFDEPAFDELAHARRVAERFDTDHHEYIVQPNATEVLPLLVRHYGEPYADSSAVPTFYVSKLARQHVTVALNGDGGDENFAGYDRYRAVWLGEWFHRAPGSASVAAALRRAAAAAPGLQPRWRRRSIRFLEAAQLPLGERYLHWATLTHPAAVRCLLAPDVATAWLQDRSAIVEQEIERNARLRLVDRLLSTDVASYLPYDLLVKMDIASMANSLETRSPLLDHEVMEFTARLPADLKLKRGWEQKYLLKKLARKLIPAENIDRPKMGFGVPVGSWLRGPLKQFASDALFDGCGLDGFFQEEAVRRLWKQHQSTIRDHTHTLWSLLVFAVWRREFFRL
ncbi:MAG TPA: asparagine synthase (glutamine-hydrolyzing) [Chloroflexota bacterium]|nr:asparagine synthase (glutamine-hydrolyzing) [Chloroflexota bacterium]